MDLTQCLKLVATLFVLSLVFGASLSEKEDNGSQGDNQKEEDTGALVSVETEDEQTGDFITKFDGAFGKDVYDPDLPEFRPTREWQPVRQGQAIPKGLHVRLNMETGEKEAKLLPDDDGSRFEKDTNKKTSYSGQGHPSRLQSMKDAIEQAVNDLESDKGEDFEFWKDGERQGMAHKNKKSFSRDELKDALKKMKANQDDVQIPVDSKNNFYRKIEDIKKDFKDLKVDMKTDLEILKDLLTKYKDPDLMTQNRINILTDFEYYLHQIDNALNFAQMGGLDLVILDLNSTNEDIRSEAAFVIGSAVQSNPTVQIAAIEGGAMQQLIRMLSTETTLRVRLRIIYALGSLIRQFPHAQTSFIKLGGVQALTDLFAQQGSDSLKMKAVTLMTDLLVEKKTNNLEADENDETKRLRAEQYNQVNVEQTLLEQGWCNLVPKLIDTTDHDSREKVLHAMTEFEPHCHTNFLNHLDTLRGLRSHYKKLSLEEGDDEDKYFGNMMDTLENLLNELEKTKKEEL